MAKRFFLSTRKDRSAEANALSDALKARGWERTFAWTPDDSYGVEGLAATALAELKGVSDADVLIVLLPGGFGTHVEIGAALALGKRVILHASDQSTLETPYRCAFHYHPSVRRLISAVPDVGALVACADEL